MSDETPKLDWNWIKERLGALWGRNYWKSLEQLAETGSFRDMLASEFPEQARALPDEMTRRDFLKLMGASLMLAGLGGCSRQPLEKIIPYVRSPENMIPGRPLFFATAMPFGEGARGIVVESHTGRPTRIDGNSLHPESLGAADIQTQASILSLYDPDRSQVVNYRGQISTWEAFVAAAAQVTENARMNRGRGLYFLTGSSHSPTFTRQVKTILTEWPEAKWVHYESAGMDNVWKGAELAFGERVRPVYALPDADVILTLDSDFLNAGPESLRHAREFARRRRAYEGKPMNRLYSVESTPTVTGSMADHRLPLKASEIAVFLWALAGKLGLEAPSLSNAAFDEWIGPLAEDLKVRSGRSLVVVGDGQPPEVHALAHAINQKLGSAGKTVSYLEAGEMPAGGLESLKVLAEDMASGRVETLIIAGANPVYDAPADLGFAAKMDEVPLRMHLGLYQDETAELSHWHVPAAHYLESWGDVRAWDGTVSFLQPMIEPLYGGKSASEFLAVFFGKPGQPGDEILKEYWKTKIPVDFDKTWRKILHDGVLENSRFAAKPVALKTISYSAPGSVAGMEVIFRPDPSVGDGRFSNNGWLQELPKPLTKLTWDNAILIAPATAEKLGLQSEDLVELVLKGRSVHGAVWIQPGHPFDSVTVFLGYGRTRAGRVGTGAGFNANQLRTVSGAWFDSGLEIRKTGKTYKLSCTQDHQNMEGRNLVREAGVEEYKKHPHFAHEGAHEPGPELSLYPPVEYKDYAWGMVIDLSSCIGCSACVVACQSENNIPIVGKKEVERGREMHWIRVDRYYQGGLDNPEIIHQPVTCMHCENAPCEPVCPVGATTHSPEGLNEMTYNRCVGTRYCSNNCPYKVRRFNFLEYTDSSEVLKLMRNPDVTVRGRGVMEKCTYCVQRINSARIESKKQDRKIRDGEIQTACQTACPTEAITFGDINDKDSRVAKLKALDVNYGILTELGTRPRTTYLARIRNPNPALESFRHGH